MALHRQNILNCRWPFTDRMFWTADSPSQAERSELQTALHKQNVLNCRWPFTGRTFWTADGPSQAEHSEMQMALHRQNVLNCRWPFTDRTFWTADGPSQTERSELQTALHRQNILKYRRPFTSPNTEVTIYLPLLKPLHILNNVELLPAFWEVDGALRQQVVVSNVYKCKVLQHQASETKLLFTLLFHLQGFHSFTSSTHKYSTVWMSVIKRDR